MCGPELCCVQGCGTLTAHVISVCSITLATSKQDHNISSWCTKMCFSDSWWCKHLYICDVTYSSFHLTQCLLALSFLSVYFWTSVSFQLQKQAMCSFYMSGAPKDILRRSLFGVLFLWIDLKRIFHTLWTSWSKNLQKNMFHSGLLSCCHAISKKFFTSLVVTVMVLFVWNLVY